MRGIIPLVRTRQPAGIPRIDWSNPITKGLVSLVYVCEGKAIDLVRPDIVFTITGVSRSSGRKGTGHRLTALGANGIEGPRGNYGKANIQFPISHFLVGETANTDNAVMAGCGNGTNGGYAIGGFSLGRIIRFYTGTAQFITDSGAWNNARGVFGFVADGANASIWDGGKKIKTATMTGTITYDNSFGHRQIFGDNQDGGNGATGFAQFDAVWNRVLSDGEANSFGINPWQVFAPEARLMAVDAGAPANATGTFASTLAPVAMASSGAVVNAGSFASTLGPVAMAASGVVAVAPSGTFASTLGAVAMSASGSVLIPGAFASTLGAVGMSAAGVVAPHATGTFASTLGAVQMAFNEGAVVGVTAKKRRRVPRRDLNI
ncbi:MAG: hypothetical protein V4633_13535 [Pseudomonadota bacterium]